MAQLRLRGVLGTPDLDIPLGSFVMLIDGSHGEVARRLVFDGIAAHAKLRMSDSSVPGSAYERWTLGERARLGVASGLRACFVCRPSAPPWSRGAIVGDLLGLCAPLGDLMLRGRGQKFPKRCGTCEGEGSRATLNVESLVADSSLSLAQGAISPWTEINSQFFVGLLRRLAADVGFDMDTPWGKLSASVRTLVLRGHPESHYQGVVFDMERRFASRGASKDEDKLEMLSPYFLSEVCLGCEGTGLGGACQAARAGGVGAARLYESNIGEILSLVDDLGQSADEALVPALVEQVRASVALAEELGLLGLSLGQRADSLSPSAAARLHLAQVLGQGLSQAIYLIDSLAQYLSSAELAGVFRTLKRRIASGDSVIWVEPDVTILRAADHVIDIETAGSAPLVS